MTRFKLPGRGTTALTATALIALASAPTLAHAQPVVVADIAPVAALSDSLLGAPGATVLLIGPGASPHSAALRPSQARGLQDADIVVGVGPALAPGIWEQIETLAADAPHLVLMDVDGLERLPFPEAGARDDSDHSDHDAHDDHAHDEHDEHDDHDDHDDHDKHDDDHAHDAHDDGHGDHAHDDHAHVGDTDPHMWLNPENAALWTDALADRLGALDPENAALYAQRAAASKDQIAAAARQVAATLAPYAGRSVINAHDDMRYFTSRFGLDTAGAVIPADGSAPGARSVVKLSERLAQGDIGCLLTDPAHPSRLARQLASDAGVAVAELAPLGTPGQSYPEMLIALGDGMADCLSRSR